MGYKSLIFALQLLFLSSCVHSEHEPLKYVTVKNRATSFYEYLPESKIPVRKVCELAPGTFEVFAPPWRAEGTSWVFVNFKQKPSNCEFWQGFVSDDNLDLSSFEFLTAREHIEVEDSLQVTEDQNGGGFAKRFIDYYSDKANYDTVFRKVMTWYGEKREGCVAFASTALRTAGVPIPLYGLKGNDAISIVTKPFAEYLLEDLGWQKIVKLEDAQPGDIGVTVSVGAYVGYPTHVYVFAGWENKNELLAKVIDNQGFTHPRPLLKSSLAEFIDKDPTDYFIRPR